MPIVYLPPEEEPFEPAAAFDAGLAGRPAGTVPEALGALP
jgi:hypothetical protein